MVELAYTTDLKSVASAYGFESRPDYHIMRKRKHEKYEPYDELRDKRTISKRTRRLYKIGAKQYYNALKALGK